MISSRPISERRKDPRLDGNIPVKICQENGDIIDIVTETQNISRSGTYCSVNQYIAPMTKLKIYLLLPSPRSGKSVTKKISCEGIIVRSEPVLDDVQYHIAIFFSDIKQRDAEYITDYVHDYLQKDEMV